MSIDAAFTVLLILIITLAVLALFALLKLVLKRFFGIELGDDVIVKLFKLYGFEVKVDESEDKGDAIFDAIMDTYTHSQSAVTAEQLITSLARKKVISPEKQAKLLEMARKNRTTYK
jgi:uncharacterized FlgJ-related protein